jgi:hypothetical protein
MITQRTRLIRFFLKQASHAYSADVGPPYLLEFKLEPDDIADVQAKADILLDGLQDQTGIGDPSQAARLTIADLVLGNGHTDPEHQEVLAYLLVHLATDTGEKRQEIEDGANAVGFLMTPSAEILDDLASQETSSQELTRRALENGVLPFEFEFVATRTD